ncbi:MAG: hypothetical protein WCP45_13740 [Verrucomicrobiota bacterium]
MKTIIVSYLSKFLSTISMPLSGAGIYLSGKGVVDLSDAATVDAAGASIATGLVVIASAIISRLLGKWLTGPSSPGSAGTSGWTSLFVCATAAGIMGSLPSCASTTTTTTSTAKDGSIVTVVTKSTSGDAATIQASTNAAGLLLPYLVPTRVIHADK